MKHIPVAYKIGVFFSKTAEKKPFYNQHQGCLNPLITQYIGLFWYFEKNKLKTKFYNLS